MYEDKVYELLVTLDTNKANGHDNISATCIYNAGNCHEYTPLVTHLFNTSIQLEELPNEWKLSCKA